MTPALDEGRTLLAIARSDKDAFPLLAAAIVDGTQAWAQDVLRAADSVEGKKRT